MQTNDSVICLVSISVERGFETKQQKLRAQKIKRRLQDCFPDIVFIYDSISSSFDLNQTFGEVITPLATSFGLMDFVSLPLADSIWINKLYITREIDIRVFYVENYDKPNMTYQEHSSFPKWDNISMYQYPEEREKQYNAALEKMMAKARK